MKKPNQIQGRDALKQFREANPDLKNIDEIQAGSQLNVPKKIADDRRLHEFGVAVNNRTTDKDTSNSFYEQFGIARIIRDTGVPGQEPGKEGLSPVGERFDKLMVRNGMPHIQTRKANATFDQAGNLNDFSFGAKNLNNDRAFTFSGAIGKDD